MSARDEVEQAGRDLKDAQQARDRARLRLARAIPQARDQGLTVTEIARLAGVTRQTVYTLMAGHMARRPG